MYRFRKNKPTLLFVILSKYAAGWSHSGNGTNAGHAKEGEQKKTDHDVGA
jgi:hypothetical protein